MDSEPALANLLFVPVHLLSHIPPWPPCFFFGAWPQHSKYQHVRMAASNTSQERSRNGHVGAS